MHSDEDFGYHVAYLSGSGGEFFNGGTYTSNGNHEIKIAAGFGIKTHAALVGLYEFFGKSILSPLLQKSKMAHQMTIMSFVNP